MVDRQTEMSYNRGIRFALDKFFFLVVYLISLVQLGQATWWLLGTDFNYQPLSDMAPDTHLNHCNSFPFLVERQKFLCLKSGKVLTAISAGAKLGIEECQYQLQSHRWNCSVIREAENVFGKVLGILLNHLVIRIPVQGSREKAYVHAISAASLAYQVTKSCAKGELEDCSCDEEVRKRNNKGKWQWGGCSEDVTYGALFSKEFADSTERLDTPDGLMNLHNNEAGRRLLKTSMNMTCKCHGVSGSCTMKVCWRVLTPFRSVGEKINEKFEGAFRVKAVRNSASKKGKLRLKPFTKDMKKPTKRDLVFMDESPDYCNKNDTLHVLGTAGRVCNQTSDGPDGCKLLCCGRGYQTMIREGEDSCNCQFIWCCKVKCETCPYKREEYICRNNYAK